MGRTERLRQVVYDYLHDMGTSNTHEIYDHVNERLRHGCVMYQLANILAKDARFEKRGEVRVHYRYNVTNKICTWGLRDDRA